MIAPELRSKEFVPVTKTELFEELVVDPIVVVVPYTEPPLEITKLLLEPLLPTVIVLELLSVDPVPVTKTELFEELVVAPIAVAVP